MSGAEAQRMFEDAPHLLAHADKDIGVLFIEFLRTHGFKNESGSDAQRALGNILFRMSRQHTSFPIEFRNEFGVSLVEAENTFIKFMTETEGNPEARFAGTIFFAGRRNARYDRSYPPDRPELEQQ